MATINHLEKEAITEEQLLQQEAEADAYALSILDKLNIPKLMLFQAVSFIAYKNRRQDNLVKKRMKQLMEIIKSSS